MAYGLKCFDSNGNVLIDLSEKGFCLIDSFTAPDNSSISKSYPEWSGYTIMGVATRFKQTGGHSITVSGTTVTCTPIILSSDYVVRHCASSIKVYVR